MGNPYFRFKQFTIHHDRCAMKVGMDGSLLGAWAAQHSSPLTILDIGTGTGLIALMCAQRFPQAEITAIDVQEDCLSQAKENVHSSPWSNRIQLQLTSLQDFLPETTYDLIVCNPPFFKNSSKSGFQARDTARHDDELPFVELISHASRLLNAHGVFALIVPEERASETMNYAEQDQLHLLRSVQVRGSINGPVKRRLLEFSLSFPTEAPSLSELTIESGIKTWTKEYAELLKEFYLAL